ncbi:MAG: polysaccharide biosynthesis tyrosine autokinase [Bacteroidales bacterium]|nr:polysaccharide biosynthesis tyrosine autokinase [Bacteroidales bacterium]
MKKEIKPINDQLNPKLIKSVLQIYWYIIPISLALTFLTAFLYLRYTIPTYQAVTTIQKSDDKNISFSGSDNDFLARQESPNKIINLIQSKTFLESSLSKLNLDVDYYLKGKVLDSELFPNNSFEVIFDSAHPQLYNTPIYIDFLDKNQIRIYCTKNDNTSKTYTVSQDTTLVSTPRFAFDFVLKTELSNLVGHTYYCILQDAKNRNEKYIHKITAYPSENANGGIDISLTYNNADKAGYIINSITKDFLDFYAIQRQESFNKVLEYIDTQLEIWEQEVYNREETLDEYKKNKNFIAPDDKNIHIIQEDYDECLAKLNTLEQTEKRLRKIEKSFETESDPYKLMGQIIGSNLQYNVSNCIDKIQQLLLEKENLQYNYTTNSGKIQNLNHQINVQINALKEIIQNNITSIKDEKDLLQQKIKSYQAILKSQDNFSNVLEFKKLLRNANISNSYYDHLLESRMSYTLLKAGTTSPFIVLQYSSPASLKATPDKFKIYIIFIVIGLILSTLYIVYKYLTYNYIDSKDDITKYVDIPYLGSIPKMEEGMDFSQLVVDIDPKSIISEAFRRLRSNLTFMNNSNGPKLVSTTSTVSGEGKTFITVNLAGIFAYSGKKVVILDMDMRKPKIHMAFSTPEKKIHNIKGMSNILIGEYTWKECINESRLENLYFITAGSIPPNPSELLMSDNMTRLLEELKQNFDYIFFDNPPVGLVTDAIACMRITDYPIYVFKEHYSIIPYIETINNLYEEQQMKKLSFVLNASSHEDNKHKKYGYGYGYGDYYHYVNAHNIQETSFIKKHLSFFNKQKK